MKLLIAICLSPFVDQEAGMLLAKLHQDALVALRDLMQTGQATLVIDRTDRLSEIPAVIRHSKEGHASAKITIDLLQT